ncbi:site-specific DNA-methyltransferase [Gluconobacter albidus]|uniref:DNA-methyltransferase n=1 Tax=Gluconobacter albidus TaxID=318683 RepID=UPI00209E251A|nr:site-specific DNA-methyltransferase [Gluconobacter albidus]MCP1274991.1 site-specific DNA-methyltransferase [Gluconobacter albidus]
MAGIQIEGLRPSYTTIGGAAFCGDSRELLTRLPDESLDLVMTSPPFALQRHKAYGGLDQVEYLDWLIEFARLVYAKLKPTGSFVMDVGGAYQKGVPTRSLYHLRLPIRFCDEIGFFLAEDFYWFNPAKLPSPIEWVNKRKIRAKDSVNNLWWFSKTEWPRADTRKVLTPYSDRMIKLMEDPDKFYKPGVRPSGHDIGKGFAKNNGGAIPSNLLQIPNTESNGDYVAGCKLVGADRHPARFPSKIPEFFIRFLTDPGDTVLDIFAGSNTTGMVAEREGRRWLAFEDRQDYLAASIFRFLPKDTPPAKMQSAFSAVSSGRSVDLTRYMSQVDMFNTVEV